MKGRYSDLPLSLKIVCWFHAISAAFQLVSLLIVSISGINLEDLIIGVVGSGLSVLFILGVLDKSRFIRMVWLVLTGLTIIWLVPSMVMTAYQLGAGALFMMIPISACAFNFWSLMNRKARKWFGVGAQPEDPELQVRGQP